MSPSESKAIEWVLYAGVGLVTVIILPLLAWLGRRQVSQWEAKIKDLEDQIEGLERDLRGQHGDVSDDLGGLKDEIHDLREDLQ